MSEHTQDGADARIARMLETIAAAEPEARQLAASVLLDMLADMRFLDGHDDAWARLEGIA